MTSTFDRYVRDPRARLLALRHFCAEGFATPPSGDVLERLFPAAAPVGAGRRTRAARQRARVAQTALPKEVFYHVLKFWRTRRDCDSDYDSYDSDSADSDSVSEYYA